jgi:hypothetical protein
MSRIWGSVLVGGAALAVAAAAFAASDAPTRFTTIDQNLDQTTLDRFHYTDQGTRLVPAAWLAALEKADGGRFMNADDLRRLGFLVDNVVADPMNPYGWPVGFTVSDPRTTGGVPVAGFTCALCHTGQIEYKGAAVRIEGGQAMIDLPGFVSGLFAAFASTAADPSRRARFFAEAIRNGYPAGRIEADFAAASAGFDGAARSPGAVAITQLETGHGRLDAVQGIANQVFGSDLTTPANLKNLDAPVNFPYLWDIWRLSWLQYNGFLPPQSTSRNIGEVLGSRAETHLVDPRTGALNPEPLRWRTSIQLGNILWMEKTLDRLRAPAWPQDVLGPIDQQKAQRGGQLFSTHCAGCHGVKELPDGRWGVAVVPLNKIGTDPGQAMNWASRTYDASKLGLGKETPASDLAIAVNAMRKQLYADNNTPAAEQEADVDFEAPCGYKARPLIGVWATPPFLHNGSVRTIYDLLSDVRPDKFIFGSREYDPVNLGYTEDRDTAAVVLDTSIAGNRNSGHWWTDETSRPGRIGPKLAEADKYAIIEFLKAATYDNYPTEKRARMAAMPCQGQKDWARRSSEPTVK